MINDPYRFLLEGDKITKRKPFAYKRNICVVAKNVGNAKTMFRIRLLINNIVIYIMSF